MKNLFEHTSASWVRYSEYEWKEKNGCLYLLPTRDAMPRPYDPMQDAETLVLCAMDIGLLCFNKAPVDQIRAAIHDFAVKYGLLGIMTALPTTAKFIDYEKVYFPYNQIVKTESMETQEYLRLFFPFDTLDFVKFGKESQWDISDRTMIALAMTYHDSPRAQVMSFMRGYGERYDWLVSVFKDWAFIFMSSFLYYNDKDTLDEETLDLYRKGMSAFENNAPTYHLEAREHPTLVWDFHSLLLGVRMMFYIMLSDETHPLRMCRQCQRAFIAPRSNSEFCSAACREKYRKGR